MTAVQVEKALKPTWQGISYLDRGKKFGTIEVHFDEVAISRMHPTTPLKTNELLLLPVYHGRRAST